MPGRVCAYTCGDHFAVEAWESLRRVCQTCRPFEQLSGVRSSSALVRVFDICRQWRQPSLSNKSLSAKQARVHAILAQLESSIGDSRIRERNLEHRNLREFIKYRDSKEYTRRKRIWRILPIERGIRCSKNDVLQREVDSKVKSISAINLSNDRRMRSSRILTCLSYRLTPRPISTSLTRDENFRPNLNVTSVTRNRRGANHGLLDLLSVAFDENLWGTLVTNFACISCSKFRHFTFVHWLGPDFIELNGTARG